MRGQTSNSTWAQQPTIPKCPAVLCILALAALPLSEAQGKGSYLRGQTPTSTSPKPPSHPGSHSPGSTTSDRESSPTSNQTAVVWAVASPPSLVLRSNHDLPVRITATQKLEHIGVTYSTLQENTTKALVDLSRLKLCANSDTVCTQPVSFDPADATPIRVRIGDVPAGTYAGIVSLSAADAGDRKDLSLTVYASSFCLRLAGFGLLGLGIGLSWLVTRWLRRVSLRATAMIPASLLQEAVGDLVEPLTTATTLSGLPFDTVHKVIGVVQRSLTISSLEQKGFIPDVIVNPFATDTTAPVSPEYSEFLRTTNAKVLALSVIVGDGILKVAQKAQGQRPLPQPVSEALTQLDGLADTSQDPGAAALAVAAIRAGLETKLAAARGQAPGAPEPPVMPSTRQLRLQIQHVSLAVWMLWGIVTWALGYVAVVASNPGFGIDVDLFKCFLWGLGVQVAGQQLLQLSPATTSQAFSIALAK